MLLCGRFFCLVVVTPLSLGVVVVRGRGLLVGAGGEERLSSLQVRSVFLFFLFPLRLGSKPEGAGLLLRVAGLVHTFQAHEFWFWFWF